MLTAPVKALLAGVGASDVAPYVAFKAANGDTLLHYACAAPTDELALVLLRSGADVNARNCRGCTPLYYACLSGKDNLITPLLANGAIVDARDNGKNDVNLVAGLRLCGATPLLVACTLGNELIAKRLLGAGAGATLEALVHDAVEPGLPPCDLLHLGRLLLQQLRHIDYLAQVLGIMLHHVGDGVQTSDVPLLYVTHFQ